MATLRVINGGLSANPGKSTNNQVTVKDADAELVLFSRLHFIWREGSEAAKDRLYGAAARIYESMRKGERI